MTSSSERSRLFASMQYLNLDEMKTFCTTHGLPLQIHLEDRDGRLRKSRDRDRKDVVLDRILRFALDGVRPGPTVYTRGVIASSPLPERLSATTRLRYGQYEKSNPALLDELRRLTDGRFRFGMIARLVLRDFWTAGHAPTLRELSDAWVEATAKHRKPRPEGAYLVHQSEGHARADWKRVRAQRAQEALLRLEELVAERAGSRSP